MRVLLFVLSVVVAVMGFGILSFAKGAIHEIQGFVLWLIAAVLFVGAAVIDAVWRAADKIIAKIASAKVHEASMEADK